MRNISCLIALALGCGQIDPTDSNDAASDVVDATVNDAQFGFGGDADTTADVALLDVYVVTYDGGGPFQCDNFVCDGRTQYCDTGSVGPPGPAHCSPLPDGCVPANCECLPNANLGMGCACEHATSGDGLVAGCAAP